MAVASPEVKHWPESPVIPEHWETERALTYYPEENRTATLGVVSRLREIAERRQVISDEILFGLHPRRIRSEAIPQIQSQAVRLATALTPYKQEGTSWREALCAAGNSVVEMAMQLSAEQFDGFRKVMALSRGHIGVAEASRYGEEWDLARAAGWALVKSDPNPYLPLLEIAEFYPMRMRFRTVNEGERKVERLVTDLLMDVEGKPGTLWVACVAHPLTPGGKKGAFYFHEIEENCQKAELYGRRQHPRIVD